MVNFELSLESNLNLTDAGSNLDKSEASYDEESEDSDHQLGAAVLDPVKQTDADKKDVTLPGISMKHKLSSEIDGSTLLHIYLTETNTICLLDIPSICVSSDQHDEATAVRAANAKYKELKILHQNNDNFISRTSQTYREPQKTKDVQATAQSFADAEVNTTQWGIFDAYNELSKPSSAGGQQQLFNVKDADLEGLEVHASLGSDKIRNTESHLGSRSIDRSISIFTPSEDEESERASAAGGGRSQLHSARLGGTQPGSARTKEEENYSSLNYEEHLIDSLNLMERAVVSNNYEKKLISYRNVVDCEEIELKRVQEITRLSIEKDLDIENNENEDKGNIIQEMYLNVQNQEMRKIILIQTPFH